VCVWGLVCLGRGERFGVLGVSANEVSVREEGLTVLSHFLVCPSFFARSLGALAQRSLGSLARLAVWEDFSRLLRTTAIPATASSRARYLLTFHTAAQSALPTPLTTTHPVPLGSLHPDRINRDSEWARVEVGVVSVEGVVRAERDAEDERRGGRMWCVDAGDETRESRAQRDFHSSLTGFAR